MQRLNSQSSVNSVSSSKNHGRKATPTHMVIQRFDNQQFLLLSTSNLVDGHATRLKQNDKATFKVDATGIDQYRGTIVCLVELFGIYSN